MFIKTYILTLKPWRYTFETVNNDKLNHGGGRIRYNMKATTTTTNQASDKRNQIIIILGIALTIATSVAMGIHYWGLDHFMAIMN